MDEAPDVEMSQDPPTRYEIATRWLEAFEDTSTPFTSGQFNEHWAHWVPRIYSPSLNENCLNWQFNEELAKEVNFYNSIFLSFISYLFLDTLHSSGDVHLQR